MTFTPDEARSVIRDAQTPAHGLLAVLSSAGHYLPTEVVEATAEAIQAWTGDDVHTQIIRDIAQHWNHDRNRAVIEWELRERTLRTLLRDGKVFAAVPVITVHPIDPTYDPGMSPGPALTDDQAAALDEMAWLEIRLTVPYKQLPGWVPATPEAVLEAG